MQAFVDRFRYKASKARQAQSRLKAMAKLEPIADLVEDRVAPFVFPQPEKALAPPLIRWEKAAVGYESGRDILRNITLRLDPDDRVALLGQNGNGKSTFAKLLCGRLEVSSGEMKHHGKMRVGYFAQHQLDELSSNRTPYDYISELMPEAPESKRRARLGMSGFGAQLADSQCETLSGGEKARLLFMLASFHGPHILVLDEPTNHLDVDSREALIMALNDFEGAVILISHDRHIIETCADRLWLVADQSVKPFDGDMEDYTRFVLDRVKEPDLRSKATGTGATATKPRASPATLKRKIGEIEAAMAKLQEKLAVLDKALADPLIYSEEPRKAADFSKLRAKLATDLEAAELEWLEAQERLQGAA
jgi:ATP-binding cassette subfamily F protein 3